MVLGVFVSHGEAQVRAAARGTPSPRGCTTSDAISLSQEVVCPHRQGLHQEEQEPQGRDYREKHLRTCRCSLL